MAPRKSSISLFPQVGNKVYFWFRANLWPDQADRKYPTALKIFDIDRRLVTSVEATKTDGDEIKEVRINGKWPANTNKPMIPIYREGELINDPEDAIKILNKKFDEELVKSSLIIKQLEEQLASVQEDHKKLEAFAKNARSITPESFEAPGKSIIITDRQLSAEDIERLASEVENERY